jgi:hypothetical protein
VNSGNANACTGDQGLRDALAMTALAARELHLPRQHVLVGSTGKVHAGETGKLLGEAVYADGSPVYESKPCEVHMRGGRVVFGSASCACGYPPQEG